VPRITCRDGETEAPITTAGREMKAYSERWVSELRLMQQSLQQRSLQPLKQARNYRKQVKEETKLKLRHQSIYTNWLLQRRLF